MRKCSYLTKIAMKSAFILFFTVAITGFAGDEIYDGNKVELQPFGCEVPVNGNVLYMRGGSLGTWSAQLHMAGLRSHLTVGGTKNPIEKVRVHKQESGRTVVTMLFKNPPAVGGNGAVLFVGSTMDDGKKRYYFGDIYESRDSHEHICEHAEWFAPHEERWTHKGGFLFNSSHF